MRTANPADPHGVSEKVLGYLSTGERLESYSTRFLRIVLPGTPKNEPAGPYNSIVRPISEFNSIPKVLKWQQKMLRTEEKYNAKQRKAVKHCSLGHTKLR
jgi:hypothetical protein